MVTSFCVHIVTSQILLKRKLLDLNEMTGIAYIGIGQTGVIHVQVYTIWCYILGAFDLLVYTNIDQDIPDTWEESQARIIAKSEEVRLRSFSTTIHKVDTMVSYKAED